MAKIEAAMAAIDGGVEVRTIFSNVILTCCYLHL